MKGIQFGNIFVKRAAGRFFIVGIFFFMVLGVQQVWPHEGPGTYHGPGWSYRGNTCGASYCSSYYEGYPTIQYRRHTHYGDQIFPAHCENPAGAPLYSCWAFYDDPANACPDGGSWQQETQSCSDGHQNGGNQECSPGGPQQGNPIHTLVGNKYQEVTDIAQHATSPLKLERYHNSMYPADAMAGGFDQYWRHNYELGIKVLPVVNVYDDVEVHSVELTREGGQRFVFFLKNGEWEGTPRYALSSTLNGSGDITGWELRYGNSLETYDANGRLLSIQNNSNSTTLTFSYQSGYLHQVVDQNGASLQFSWRSNGTISSVAHSSGETVTYDFDDQNNRLTEVHYADNTSEEYHYESTVNANFLTGITDRTGHQYVEWTYDSEGRATSSAYIDLNDNRVESLTINYTHQKHATDPRVSFTNALGKQTTFHFTDIGGQRRITQVEGHASTHCAAANKNYSYFDNGLLQSKTDWKGNTTTFVYNERGLVTTRTEAAGTAQQKQTLTEWHPVLNLPVKITKGLHVTEYTYDTTGKVLTKREGLAQTGSADRLVTYTYNANGKVATVNGPRTDVNDTTTFAYDTNGRLISTTNALGQITQLQNYDAADRPTRFVDANGVETTLVYDGFGRLLSSILIHPLNTSLNLVTSFTYDELGQLLRTEMPNGTWVEYEYDGARRLIAMENNNGDHISYVLDAAGNKLSESIRDTSGTLYYTTSRSYDELSRLLSVLGNNGQALEFEYDANDNLTSTTNARNANTSRFVDALDRVVSQLDAYNNPITYAYDAHDNLLEVHDDHGLNTEYVYDVHGNITQINSRDTGTTNYTWDAAGNRLTAMDANGVAITYSYDALNRLIAINYPQAPAENVVFSYDDVTGSNYGKGKLTGITDQSGSTQYKYDFAGRLIRKAYQIQAQSFVTEYLYSATGELETIIYPSGLMVHYSYNSLGQVASIAKQASYLAPFQNILNNISYLPFGPVHSWEYANGLVHTQIYDLDYRLTSRTLEGTALLEARAYDYDTANNISDIDDLLDSQQSLLFGYDLLDRIISAEGNYGDLGYSYDAVGNRLQRSITNQGQSSTENYQYDSTHKLQSVSVGAQTTRAFQYDDNGNIIADTAVSPSITYSYNSANRLITANVGSNTVGFLHNSLGQRVTKESAAKTEHYHYDEGGQLIAVSDAGGTFRQELVWLYNNPVAVLVTDDKPELAMTSPTANALYFPGASIVFSAIASEGGNDLSQNVIWQSSLDGALGQGANLQLTTLSVGTHIITATVAGSLLQNQISRVITVGPLLTIQTPSTTSLFSLFGQAQVFAAQAVSAADGDISSQIIWQSNIDGALGTGGNIQANLSEGQHTITASVTDSTATTVNKPVYVHVVGNSDSDSDALADAWEVIHFGNLDQDGTADADGDGLSNEVEFEFSFNPLVATPLNHFDPAKTHASLTLSNGNKTVTNSSLTWRSSIAKYAFKPGKKYYWELNVTKTSGFTIVGMGNNTPLNNYVGSTTANYGWYNNSNGVTTAGSGFQSFVNYSAADRLMIAFDPNAGKVWFGKNGTWYGDPANGTGERYNNITTLQTMAVSVFGESVTAVFNPGNFQYPMPAGFVPSLNYDVDADGMDDEWEFAHFASLAYGANDDPDADGVTNKQEFDFSLDPNDGNPDSDSDGLPDVWEMTWFGNLAQDGASDFDNDGVSNADEYTAGTNPTIGHTVNHLNPGNSHSTIVLSNNNLTATASTSAWRSAVATLPLDAGKKYYWEVAALGNYVLVGIGRDVSLVNFVGGTSGSYAWYHGSQYPRLYNGGNYTNFITSLDGDRMMLAYDSATGSLWFGKNGVWQGNPSAGTGAQFTGITGVQYPAVSVYGNGSVTLTFNSAQFLYSPPTGFQPSEVQ